MKIRNFIKVIFISVFAAIILISSACSTTNLPVYKMTDEDGTSVYIDGIRYKELPKLKWEIGDNYSKVGRDFGYAGDLRVSCFIEDTEKNFIVLQGFGDTFIVLYRTDKYIPDVSADRVDKIVWVGCNEIVPKDNNSYTNTVTDKKIIKELFDLLNNEEKTNDYNQVIADSEYYHVEIKLYDSDLPGVSYSLYIGMSDDNRIVFGKPLTGSVYLPDDLLEKIAGKHVDFEKYNN